MCNRILQYGSDPRTSLLALSIRHAQLQQMEEMRRLLRERSDDGSAAVSYLVTSLYSTSEGQRHVRLPRLQPLLDEAPHLLGLEGLTRRRQST
jgi:hypothetical protein